MYTQEKRRMTAIRIRELRKQKGLSPKELAEDMKKKFGDSIQVSEASINVWETQQEGTEKFKKGYGMRISTLCLLADYFETTVDYLIGETKVRERETLGLSERALDILTNCIPANMSFSLPKGAIKTVTHRHREEVNGKPGTIVEEKQVEIQDSFYSEVDKIPSLYIKTLNEILENHRSILSTISTIIFAENGISRSEDIEHFTVDGFVFHPLKPCGRSSINAFLDELSSEVLALRQTVQERERRNRDGKTEKEGK